MQAAALGPAGLRIHMEGTQASVKAWTEQIPWLLSEHSHVPTPTDPFPLTGH